MAGLVTTPARYRVVGARVLPRADGDGKILAADLVAGHLRPRRTRLAPAATPAAPAIAEPAK
jgi:hypothetical protein